SVIAT
ncbi:hypothetical protein D049_3927B, partial [Vibrio parahaemolyticus VPTS-2010]